MSTYDALPYTSLPYPRTHPDHLLPMARLFGLRARPVERCRVLEIGCGSAGNLIAMAESLPDATLLGVDPSAGEIARGEALRRDLGLTNLALEARDVAAIEGAFDYVILHGVLSWVPPDTRRSLLVHARRLLADEGVLYASYNVLPGWYLRGAMRGMLQQHLRDRGPEASPTGRVIAARGLIDWLSRRTERGSPMRAVLDDEIARLASADDAYLFHELLEEHNHPMWFTEFVEEARQAGLAFLGEADPGARLDPRSTPRVHASLREIAGDDPIAIEQHFDLLRARTFRASMLTHATCARREVDDLEGLFLASRGLDDGAHVEDEALAHALGRLAAAWPDALPFESLGIPSRPLLSLHAAGQVELRARALGLARPPFRAPRPSALARLQAEGPGPVTNLRHEPLPLSPDERAALLRVEALAHDHPLLARLARLGLLRDG